MESTKQNRRIQILLKKLRSSDLSRDEWAHLHSAAQGDPFLTDALEGLQSIDLSERHGHLRSIETRLGLNQRKKERKRLIAIPRLAGAAAIVILLIGSWIVWNLEPAVDKTTALETTEQEASRQTKESQSLLPNAKGEKLLEESRQQLPEPTDPNLVNSSESNLASSPSYDTRARQIQHSASDEMVLVLDGIATDESKEDQVRDESENANNPENIPAAHYADDASTRTRDQGGETTAGPSKSSSSVIHNTAQITGIIQDDTGEPLIGANVLVKGTGHGTLTDFDGNFMIKMPQPDQTPQVPATLVVSYTGYETQETSANLGDTLSIQMAAGAVLDEVQVTGLSKKQTSSRESIREGRALATPVGGERRYARYLRQSIRIPAEAESAGIHGQVVLEFTVLENGRPDDIRVIESMGYGCDEEAVRLLEEGPDWDFTSAQVPIGRVSVKF